MSASLSLTAAVHREEDWYVAQCLEVDVASQGPTIDEALANLAEAVGLFLDEVDDPAGHVSSTPLVSPAIEDRAVEVLTFAGGPGAASRAVHPGPDHRGDRGTGQPDRGVNAA